MTQVAGDPGNAYSVEPAFSQVEAGSPEYHRRLGVRRYDLTNLREDLDNCTQVGRGFAIWASVFLGVAGSAFLSFLGALNVHAALWLRETCGWGAVAFAIVGTALLVLDAKFATKATNDLSFVKRRVDGLIAFFDEETQSRAEK